MAKKGQKSALVFVSSISADCDMPGLTLYSGSKVFTSYMGEALAYEFKDTVDVISFRPASVNTNMNPNKERGVRTEKLRHDYISPERAAICCFRDLGYSRGATYGDAIHEL
jgi:17beta-estradiol 17-dehydrogenase / very-long-chain 3-oxoacyl-CoA reductase